jgi:hypothetical protein
MLPCVPVCSIVQSLRACPIHPSSAWLEVLAVLGLLYVIELAGTRSITIREEMLPTRDKEEYESKSYHHEALDTQVVSQKCTMAANMSGRFCEKDCH